VTLQGGGAGRLFLFYTLPSSPQGDIETSAAGVYVVDLAARFSRQDLEGGAFTLTIESDDVWKPDYFAVFGVDTTNAGPRVMNRRSSTVPLARPLPLSSADRNAHNDEVRSPNKN